MKQRKEKRNVTREEIYRAMEEEEQETREEIYRAAMEEEEQEVKFEWDWKEYHRTIDLDDFQSHYCKTWAEKEYEIHDIIGMTLFYGNGEIHDISRKDNLLTMSYVTTTELNLEICDELSSHGVSIKEYEYWRYRY